MTRRYYLQTPIPSSTPQVLVFPFDYQNTKRFNTSSYMPQLTQGRATIQEIEAFLDEIQVPVDEYVKKFSHLWNPPCWLIIFQVFCYLIFPLAIIMMCYQLNKISESKLKVAETRQKAEAIAKQKGVHFMQKDLMWVIPSEFPRWIEFWTTLSTRNNNMNMNMGMNMNMNMNNQSFMNTSMMDQSGIALTQMPQKQYQMQQNFGYLQQQGGYNQQQYNQNMYR